MTTAHSNKITGITTDSFTNTEIVNKKYVDQVVPLPSLSGNGGKYLYSTDGITQTWDYISNTQEFTTIGQQSFTVPSRSNVLFIEIMGGGGGGGAGSANGTSGAGGGSGSYSSWYIPTNIVNSDLTIIVGSGGTGGISDGQLGSAGLASTVSFTGSGSVGVVTLTSFGAGSDKVAASSQPSNTGRYYSTVGLAGVAGRATDGAGNQNMTVQANYFQATGGGGGARSTGATSYIGGPGGAINLYGNTISSPGGSGAANGTSSTALNGVVYGYGAGGGGANNPSGVGNGGQGIRGSGGGGGGTIVSGFGTGGNGGNGFVRITWF